MIVEAIALGCVCSVLWLTAPGDDAHYVDDAWDWVAYRWYSYRWARRWAKIHRSLRK